MSQASTSYEIGLQSSCFAVEMLDVSFSVDARMVEHLVSMIRRRIEFIELQWRD
jgi:hypothetical protein